MADIQFYHLTSTTLERALPKLLEKSLKAGFTSVVTAASSEQAEALSAHLWQYDPATFLPHGTEADGNAERQPVFLTAGDANPAAADLLVVTDGRSVTPETAYKRILDIFDGTDDTALSAARGRWKTYAADGHTVAYIKQSESGAWEKQG